MWSLLPSVSNGDSLRGSADTRNGIAPPGPTVLGSRAVTRPHPSRRSRAIGPKAGAAAALILLQAGCAETNPWVSVYAASHRLFDTAFDPDRNFAGDLRPSSDDGLVLTIVTSGRDDHAPALSLAIAYRCLPNGEGGQWQCRYVARALRVGPDDEELTDRSLALVAAVDGVDDPAAFESVLERANLQWLEADVGACEGGILAMDSIRVADWRPDMHYALQPVEERDVVLHPAMIRVRMTGTYVTSRYQGWVLDNGVPAAACNLLETLEPCWRPSRSPRPWQRRLRGRRR
jgi:hypothetical protein